MPESSSATLLLIDANALVHRAFHALPPLTARDGRPVQALYGISSILLKIVREDGPEYAVACFDRPEPTFRKERYAAYKAQRPPTPDALISQIVEAHELFSRFGIRVLEKPGYEGDDLIATVAERFRSEQGVRVVILTGDLDTLQLVEGEKGVVRTFRKGVSDTVTYGEEAVVARYGLKPSQLTDYKALIGAPSDNVKGVPGVGPKTAAQLLEQFGSLENFYARADQDQKIKEKLVPFHEQVLFSKSLVTLERNVPIPVGALDGFKVKSDEGRLRQYFGELGFETLMKRLDGSGAAPRSNGTRGKQARQGKIF